MGARHDLIRLTTAGTPCSGCLLPLFHGQWFPSRILAIGPSAWDSFGNHETCISRKSSITISFWAYCCSVAQHNLFGALKHSRVVGASPVLTICDKHNGAASRPQAAPRRHWRFREGICPRSCESSTDYRTYNSISRLANVKEG